MGSGRKLSAGLPLHPFDYKMKIRNQAGGETEKGIFDQEIMENKDEESDEKKWQLYLN